jgi:2-C-methyl-D-erythritol 2,4-cyclodiphosphate synthase
MDLPATHRIGFGYDVHRFLRGRRLVLGGVRIPYPLGLEGHSDADVVLHAICDAILGAAALGDIGQHFPNTSRRYKNISSLKLLEAVARLIGKGGMQVVNVDATIVLEEPKLMPYVPSMRRRIARSLGIRPSFVSVKATTSEGLGFAGRREGCAAFAVALIATTGANKG